MEVAESCFQYIPQELVDILALYLNYTEFSIISQFFNLDTNYKLLLMTKYPPFYNLVTELSKIDVKYRDYNFRHGYDLMCRIELCYHMKRTGFGMSESTLVNLVYDEDGEQFPADAMQDEDGDIYDFISTCYELELHDEELLEMSSMYDEYTRTEDRMKYIKYFPNIPGGDESFMITTNDNIDMTIPELIKNYNTEKGPMKNIIWCLYRIFFELLKDPKKITKHKDAIMAIQIRGFYKGYYKYQESLDHITMYSYIVDFMDKYND
jgi:hypothetical protein